MMRWFTVNWWRYLLALRSQYGGIQPWLIVILCRARGHGAVVWYGHGDEPDMHCEICGDDLG